MMDQKYQSEDDFRTLERAEEVREDASRHRRAMGHGSERLKQISKIVQRGRGKKTGSKRGVARRRSVR